MAVHMLIVDADPGAAASTCAFVQHLEPAASIVCESTPERAWCAAQRTPPDLLLIDPAPFGASGSLVIQLCQQSWVAMRVVVLTSARVSPSLRQQYHADVYLEKPASPAGLRDALTSVLNDMERAAPAHAPSRLSGIGQAGP